jgi:hypothetical protein
MCLLKLRAPDGKVFFLNGPNELQVPNKELCLGINLEIDWYVLLYISTYIMCSHFLGSCIYVVTFLQS